MFLRYSVLWAPKIIKDLLILLAVVYFKVFFKNIEEKYLIIEHLGLGNKWREKSDSTYI